MFRHAVQKPPALVDNEGAVLPAGAQRRVRRNEKGRSTRPRQFGRTRALVLCWFGPAPGAWSAQSHCTAELGLARPRRAFAKRWRGTLPLDGPGPSIADTLGELLAWAVPRAQCRVRVIVLLSDALRALAGP
eukprot:7015126-Pyramimonas_sp.AAC.1